jgi:hypothetical protein
MSKLADSILPSAVRTILEKLETEEELPQEEVQKFHATALSVYETALSYLKKWTDKSFQDLETNRTPSSADTERTSSLVIKTVLSVQLAENEMYEGCVCM